MASSDPAGPPVAIKARRICRGIGLALVATLVQTVGTAIVARDRPDLLGYVLLAASGLALARRHRFPRATVMFVAAVTVAYHVLDYPRGPTFLALFIAAVVATKVGHRGLVGAVLVVSYAAWIVLAHARLGPALTVAAWAVGLGLLTEAALGVARMAGQMAREQRRLFEERQRRQASEGRLRIAQELHDVLGHHLSLINVRAGVGLHLMDRQPEEARAALDTIKQASAEALREVQSVINTLYPTDQGAPRAPAPRLERLDELTVDAGLPVHATISGEPRLLPAEIDRAAYRIIQEALTNVRRHAGAGATATVTIEYRPDGPLVVQIDDNGGGRPPADVPVAAGNGISGMRERARALGGSLTAQPLPDGGWRVHALLPVPDAALPVPMVAEPGPDRAP
jgi:signal transduction histidine kinase